MDTRRRAWQAPRAEVQVLLVMQYILKYAADEHPVTIADIEGHLLKYGIEAERRSIYRDINDLMDLMNAELDEDNKIAKRDRLGYEIVHTQALSQCGTWWMACDLPPL